MMAEVLQKTQLPDDILYIIAEKMFFGKLHSGKIDLTTKNAYTMFMFHSLANKNAVFAQLGKMKRIEFTTYGKTSDIKLYKNKEYATNWDFGGPYYVTNTLISEMIARGKVNNLAVIDLNDYIKEKFEIKQCGMTCLEVFSSWLLGKELDAHANLDLSIEKLRVSDSVENIKQNFEAILLLNAEVLEFSYCRDAVFFECSQLSSGIVAERTKKIIIKSEFCLDLMNEMDSVIYKWKSMLGFLLNSCPKLHSLEFHLSNSFTDANAYTADFHALILEVVNNVLANNNGDENLKINIEFTSHCDESVYENLPLDDHPLYKIGNAFTIEALNDDPDEQYTARAIEVIDKTGRKHKCVFRIFPEKSEFSDMDASDDYQYDCGGFYDYDDFEDYSPDEYGDYDDEDVY